MENYPMPTPDVKSTHPLYHVHYPICPTKLSVQPSQTGTTPTVVRDGNQIELDINRSDQIRVESKNSEQ